MTITYLFIVVALAGLGILIKNRNNTQNTKASYSLRLMAQRAWQTTLRFQAGTMLVLLQTILLLVSINCNDVEISYRFWMFFTTGALISVSTVLWIEERFKHLTTLAISLIAIILWGMYCYYLPEKEKEIHTGKWLEIMVMSVSIAASILILPFLKTNRDREFWNFSINTIQQAGLAFLYGFILFLGLSLAVLGVNTLFGTAIEDKIYGNLASVCLALFSPLYLMSNIPVGENKFEFSIYHPKVLKTLSINIFIPILFIYAVILYAYLIKIVVIWELPNGWVSWLVSALALGGLFVTTITYPIREQENNKILSFIERRMGYIILPLLALMSLGIFRRIGDYGMTINRGYILLLNIWFYGIYIYLIISKSKHIKWILTSMMVIAISSSINLFGVASYTRQSLVEEISTLFEKPMSADEARAALDTMSNKDKDRLKSTLLYLHKHFGHQSVQPFFKDTVSDDYWSFLNEIGLKDSDFRNWELVNYDAAGELQTEIKDFQHFQLVNFSIYGNKRDQKMTQSLNSIHIHIDSTTYSFTTTEIAHKILSSSEKQHKNMTMKIEGNNSIILFKSFHGRLYNENDSVAADRFEAFLFYNNKKTRE